MTFPTPISAFALTLVLAATAPVSAADFTVTGSEGTKLTASPITEFDEPWALAFLPDGSMLVAIKPGKLFHVTQDGRKTEIGGVPEVAYGGQGGLGDVVPHPDFSDNSLVYFSYVDSEDGGATRGAVVARAELDLSSDTPQLADVEEIWRQQPFRRRQGALLPSHRLWPRRDRNRRATYSSRPANGRNRRRRRI